VALGYVVDGGRAAGAAVPPPVDAKATARLVALINMHPYGECPPDKVQDAIDKGADPNGALSGGMPVFYAAVASQQSTEVLRALVKAGADVNRPEPSGITPLIVLARESANAFDPAAVQAFLDKLVLLLDAGARVNAVDPSGMTPLMAAVANGGSITFIKTLLKAGADVKAADHAGATALTYAQRRLDAYSRLPTPAPAAKESQDRLVAAQHEIVVVLQRADPRP